MKAKQIDTDVAVPEGWSRERSRYGLEALKTGSSFFTAFSSEDSKARLRQMQRMHSSARRLAHKHKCRLSVGTRALEENQVQGFRTWVLINEILDKK